MEINEAIKRIPQMVPEILLTKPQNAGFQVSCSTGRPPECTVKSYSPIMSVAQMVPKIIVANGLETISVQIRPSSFLRGKVYVGTSVDQNFFTRW